MQKEQNEDEFFDATIDESNENITLAEAKLRAEQEAKMLATIADDMANSKNDKRTFRRVVFMSIGSVVFLLILAIIFFVCLHWHAVGAGVAIIAFIVAQVWLHFFKKWDYGAKLSTTDTDPIDSQYTQTDENDKNSINNETNVNDKTNETENAINKQD